MKIFSVQPENAELCYKCSVCGNMYPVSVAQNRCDVCGQLMLALPRSAVLQASNEDF